MKILILQDDFPPHVKGGAGIVAAELTRALASRGHDLTIVTATQDRSLVGSFRESGLRIERVYSDYHPRWRSWRSIYNPATVREVRRVIAEVKPDIVHAHNIHYHLSYWSLRIAKKSGARVFLTAHDVMLFHYGKLVGDTRMTAWRQLRQYRFWYNPFRNILIKHLLKNVDKIFAVSDALKHLLEQNGIKNIEVIHNGIDAGTWDVPRSAVDTFIQKHRLENKKTILFGGRISGLKGGEIMLAAVRDLVTVEPNAVLLLLGTHDAYVEKLERQADEWGIGGHLVATGWLAGDELHAAYHAATLVVMPSLCFETFGMVALEAMACAKPVIGSNFGGLPEVVADGETGYVLNSSDHPTLVARLAELLADEKKCAAFGRAGRQRALQEFSLEKWCETTLAAYTGKI